MVSRGNVWRIVKIVRKRKRKKKDNSPKRIVHVNYKQWGYAKNWITILTSQWVTDLGD